jgi:hypothetical protein
MTWLAAAVFISYRRLESLQMQNSFQNKKKFYLFRYLNINLFKKTLENKYYVPFHDMYNNQNTKLNLTSADTNKQ